MARPKTLKIDEIAQAVSPVFTDDVAKRFATWRMLMGFDLGTLSGVFGLSTTTLRNMEQGNAPNARFTLAQFAEFVGGIEVAVWILTGSGKPPKSHELAELERKERQRTARAKQWDRRISEMLAEGYKDWQVAQIYPLAWRGFLDRKKKSESVKAEGDEAEN